MHISLDRKLQALYILTLVAGACVFAYYELLNDEALQFEASTPDSLKYGAEFVADLLAVLFVYLSTRLMRMSRVQASLAARPSRYAFWACLRWGMLASVIFLGLGVRYAFLSPSTMGCPIIGALAMCFVWPTARRREGECGIQPKEL